MDVALAALAARLAAKVAVPVLALDISLRLVYVPCPAALFQGVLLVDQAWGTKISKSPRTTTTAVRPSFSM